MNGPPEFRAARFFGRGRARPGRKIDDALCAARQLALRQYH